MKKIVVEFAELSEELYKLCSKKELSRRKCLDLGKMECELLYHMAEVNKPICMNDLAVSIGVSHSRITRIVDNLVYKEYVRRFPSPKDRRSWLGELTKEGVAANKASVTQFLSVQQKILKKLPKDRLPEILSSINLYIDAYKIILEENEGE